MQNLEKEQALLKTLQAEFSLKSSEVKRIKRVEVKIEKKDVVPVLLYAKERLEYNAFAHMSCVDWLENNLFELVYILWSPTDKVQLIIKTETDREKPVMPNIDFIWRQANTYERELREMYGIQFDGLVGREEFILEDWNNAPPMKRDFDTEKFSTETYFDRNGRDDAKDVRETLTESTGEVIPEYAKKYSRD